MNPLRDQIKKVLLTTSLVSKVIQVIVVQCKLELLVAKAA